MDDYLTVFDNPSNGVTKFESVQSRFDRLHVPLRNVQWILCDFCGSLVNHLLFESHHIQHQLIDLAYSLNHFELAEERKVQKLSRRIQRKEKRQQFRNHSFVGLDEEDETDTSDSSAASSSGDSSSSEDSDSTDGGDNDEQFNHHIPLPTCSNSIVIRNQPQKGKKMEQKLVAVKKEHQMVEEKEKNPCGQGKKRATTMIKKRVNSRREAISLCVVNGNGEQQRSERNLVQTAGFDDSSQLLDIVKTENSCDGVVTTTTSSEAMAQVKRTTMRKKAEIVVKTEVDIQLQREAEEQRLTEAKERQKRNREEKRKRRNRALLEAELMRRYLGPNHHRVFVDNSAALDAYFDRRTGHVLLNSLRSPPPQLRRSRRGVATEDGELHCLL